MKNPTPDDFKKAMTDCLAFEFYHFEFYSRMLRDHRLRLPGSVVQAYQYALLLHFRLLLEFLYKDARSEDDLRVVDFEPLFPKASPEPWRPRPHWFKDMWDNLNMLLAHASRHRWKPPRPDWNNYAQHFPEVQSHIDAFLQALPKELGSALAGRWNEFQRRDAMQVKALEA